MGEDTIKIEFDSLHMSKWKCMEPATTLDQSNQRSVTMAIIRGAIAGYALYLAGAS